MSKQKAIKSLGKLVMLTRMSDYKEKVGPLWETVLDHIKMKCLWTSDDNCVFESQCGFDFEFTDERENVNDYDFNFCPKCGGEIITIP